MAPIFSSFLENIDTGLELFLLGMGIVFAALILIMLVIAAVGRIFNKASEQITTQTQAVKAETALEANNQSYQNPQPEIIAAVMAAIAEYTNKPTSSIRVINFKKRKI